MRSGSLGPLPGVTGRLTVDAQGRVRRELDWAQIVGGRVSPWPPPAPLPPSPVSTAPHLELGRAAETAAARHLERLGYRILTTNFRARGGELDLVAWTATSLAIVEVRYRASDRYGGAAASITHGQAPRIVRAARSPAGNQSAAGEISRTLRRRRSQRPCRQPALRPDPRGVQSLTFARTAREVAGVSPSGA